MEKIKEFIRKNSNGTVVFDADGTLWADDVGEAFFRWLIAERKLLNVNYETDLYREYETRVQQNRLAGYKWIVSMMAGMSETELKTWAHDFFDRYFVSRIYVCQRELIAFLKERQFDVWIVSASNQWIVSAGATYLSVDESHVLGVRLAIANGVLTNEILPPFTYHQGKVEAIKKYIQKQPELVFGDSMGDLPMLEYAANLRVFITHNPSAADQVVAEAKQIGCSIHYFPLLPPLQFEFP